MNCGAGLSVIRSDPILTLTVDHYCAITCDAMLAAADKSCPTPSRHDSLFTLSRRPARAVAQPGSSGSREERADGWWLLAGPGRSIGIIVGAMVRLVNLSFFVRPVCPFRASSTPPYYLGTGRCKEEEERDAFVAASCLSFGASYLLAWKEVMVTGHGTLHSTTRPD